MNQILLVENNQPRAVICLNAGATETEQHAAREFQAHLELVSGVRLPIVESMENGARIIIGRNASTPLLPDYDWDALGEDGCLVRTISDVLILAGATPRGTLNAVYEFLERELGIRWLTAGSTHVPCRDTIAILNLDYFHVPSFRYRELFYAKNWDLDWTSRHRLEGHFSPSDEARPGAWKYAGFVHTFELLVPPEEFFGSHPEWFSLRATPFGEMERTSHNSQLCLSNPELLEFVIERARGVLQAQPEARIVSVSQNDNTAHCLCDECRAIDEAEGSPSGAMIRFVNAVASRLESEFPRVFFDTLAYQYTVAPPRHARPRRNVIVRLCHLSDVCDLHPLEKCEVNRPFLENLKAWRAISPEVFVWDYFNNFNAYFCPLPNLDAIIADVPLLARMGVTGFFAQADGTPPKGAGDMAQLRAYVLARLLWNPELDGRALIEEFVKIYYGVAAAFIREYLEWMHDAVREKPIHTDSYPQLEQAFNQPQILERAREILDSALQCVQDDEVSSARVRAAFLPLEWMWMKRNGRFEIQNSRYAPHPKIAKRARNFLELAQQNGACALQEYSGSRTLAQELETLDGFELVALENDALRVAVAPAMGGRLLSLIQKNDSQNGGREWMFSGALYDILYPVVGGYEEYSQSWWHAPGWNQNYQFEADADSIRVAAVLENGLRLQRIFRLEDSSTVKIESTLSNISNEPREAAWRGHAEYSVADWDNAFLLSRATDGTLQRAQPWRENDAGNVWIKGENLPCGAWGVLRSGAQLLIEFDAALIETCLLDWNRKDGVARFDLFAQKRVLQSGESIVARQTWAIDSLKIGGEKC